jgi:hypothetical protein
MRELLLASEALQLTADRPGAAMPAQPERPQAKPAGRI